MLAWLFERKIFSPAISGPSIFLWKKKQTKQKKKKKKKKKKLFLLKTELWKVLPSKKIRDAKLYIHLQHKI